jgi:hypothetical protein
MRIVNTIVILAAAFFSIKAMAFGAFLNSSNILKGNDYDLSGTGQFFSSDRNGAHLMGTLDLPFSDTSNLRFNAGAGSFDYTVGAGLKWVPHMENERLPFNFGAVFSTEYARDSSFDFFLFRTTPFISKNLTWENGYLEPYVALPLGMITVDSTARFHSQFIVGTRVNFENLNYMYFSIEGGFEVKNADSYIAIMTTIQLRK